MNSVLSEKEYQKYFLEKLQEQGYQIRNNSNYDRYHALDKELLFRFLWDTQPDEMQKLQTIYKDALETTLLNLIQKAEDDKSKGRLYLLKNGLEVNNVHLTFMFTKPATEFNKKLNEQYQSNIFSAAEEVWASETERVDIVTFVNGFAVTAIELKCNPAGQSYKHAITQFRKDRNPKTRLFKWNAGALVFFAMDLHEVYMTTHLEKMRTTFLPFNKGNGEGVNTGAGNPPNDTDFPVSYMWEDILSKDSLLEILSKFMFLEINQKTDPNTGKKQTSTAVIFPRYHQLDAIRKLIADVSEYRTTNNYLIQHSAGSGKTNTLAWLAHRFASQHDADNKQIFDTIVICTDRVVVDRQLQTAIRRLDHKAGLIKVMDDDCTSADLADALHSNTKIIATTIQKFPYISDEVRNLKDKNFAVLIDEAHSSTTGKNMQALEKTLSAADGNEEATVEDLINDDIERSGKQPNVAIFAFTATPKPETLKQFGHMTPDGEREPFHIYSMKQAIEEGFILDVLQNYTTYDTFVKLNKQIEEDPQYETQKAKRQIARFIDLDDTNIQQRVKIIVEHFRTTVKDGLGGTAKAMIVTASRPAAVKFQKAIQEYIARKGYDDIHSLVAFSGKVKLPDGTEYSEPQMNGFSEKALSSEFERDENNILIVANKYQTGFDQKRLSAMYVLKPLKEIAAVQTLSRLNRVMPSGQKQTFVLDFVNDYDRMREAFGKYYSVTFLSNDVTPADIYELTAKLEDYGFLDFDDIAVFNDLLYRKKRSSHDPQKMETLLKKAKDKIDDLVESDGEDTGDEIRTTIRHFIRFYEFLLLATCYKDTDIHKIYNFLKSLAALLKADDSGPGFNLKDQIAVVKVQQKKKETHSGETIHPDPALNLPKADQAYATKDNIQRLSEIIREINEKSGSTFDVDTALKGILQVKDRLTKSEILQQSAQTNSFDDFKKYAVGKQLDEALTDVLEENYSFFKMLLDDPNYKAKIISIFIPELYRQLHADTE